MHPRQSKSPIFEEIGKICTVGVVNVVLSAYVLRATTEKRSSTFSRKKSAPQRKSCLRLCEQVILGHIWFRGNLDL